MTSPTPSPPWLSIGLGLMLAAAITLLTLLAFEDMAVAHDSSTAVTIDADQR